MGEGASGRGGVRGGEKEEGRESEYVPASPSPVMSANRMSEGGASCELYITRAFMPAHSKANTYNNIK